MANNERTEKKHAFLHTKLDFNILINHPSRYHNHFAKAENLSPKIRQMHLLNKCYILTLNLKIN